MSTDKQLSSMTAEVRAKPEHHKFLIGRNGSNVQSIRDKTGARIIFPDEKDSDREVIHILGTKEAVAAAKAELESRIKGLVSFYFSVSFLGSLYLAMMKHCSPRCGQKQDSSLGMRPVDGGRPKRRNTVRLNSFTCS